jgi:hypothetical protein
MMLINFKNACPIPMLLLVETFLPLLVLRQACGGGATNNKSD